MKSTEWYICYPTDAYALGPIRFKVPVNEKEVRKWVREVFEGGISRLPNGFSCWPA